MPAALKLFMLLMAAAAMSGCSYMRLLRPSVLSELKPPLVRLVNEIPAVDQPNELVVAKLYALGGLKHAQVGPGGVMQVSVGVPEDELIWEPAIIVLPHGGTLKLRFTNYDHRTHMALVPSNGSRQLLMLPPHTSGTMIVHLDGPGWYWFFCPAANHYGRNMFGYLLVSGNVPVEAQLDRPPQPLPRD
ncbi:MAG TPA: MSMEG_3727 family PQQ-associated protein [Gammaproteobacteria bacterium]|nr:MSMEG_3727 family PQQ-associated protein [Gammaproteobacteria bacterium]